MAHLCSYTAVAAVIAAAGTAMAQPVPTPAPGRVFDVAPDAPAPSVPAGPAPATYRLDFAAPEGCPDERELRAVVASQMGADPFVAALAPAAWLVRVRIVGFGGGFAGTVELRDLAGRPTWSRPALIEADCGRLVGLLGRITLPAAVDSPPSVPASSPVPVVPPPPPPAAPVVIPPQPPAPAVATPRPAIRLGARAAVAVGVEPVPTAAISVDAGARWRFFSIAIEGRGDLPRTAGVDAGVQLRTYVLAASVVPCGHYGYFAGCAIVSAGAFRAEGVNATTPAESTGIYLAAGVRAGLEWPIPGLPALILRLSGDGLVNLHPLAPQALVGPTLAKAMPVEVWRSGPFAAMVGAGVVVSFGGER